MTYCVGLCLKDGLVFLSDTRTNAGVDQIGTFRKMTLFQKSIYLSLKYLYLSISMSNQPVDKMKQILHEISYN